MIAGGQSDLRIVMAADDALFVQRALVSLIDGGALLPLDREVARQALDALERGEVLMEGRDLNLERPAHPVDPAAGFGMDEREGNTA